MDFSDLARQAQAAVHDHIGLPVIWTPQGGAPVTVRMIHPSAPEEYGVPGPIEATTPTVMLEARAADVAPNGIGAAGSIRAGDAIEVYGETRIVRGAIEYADSLRLAVRIDTRRI